MQSVKYTRRDATKLLKSLSAFSRLSDQEVYDLHYQALLKVESGQHRFQPLADALAVESKVRESEYDAKDRYFKMILGDDYSSVCGHWTTF